MSTIAMVALEYWRASGLRTHERLRSLVHHFADISGELAYFDHHYQQALAKTTDWEIQS